MPSSLLTSVRDAAKKGTVTRKELIEAYNEGRRAAGRSATLLSAALYLIGGIIILIGIVILVSQNWEQLNSGVRILVTFGSGIAAFFMGIAFTRDNRFDSIDTIFLVLSGILMPLGLGVTFHEIGYTVGTSEVQSILSAVMLAAFLASFVSLKRTEFLVFSVIYGSWFYFSGMAFLRESDFVPFIESYEQYLVLFAGIAYLALGYGLSQTKYYEFGGVLYGFGSAGFLGAALMLGGWEPDQRLVWELLYPLFLFGIVFLSVRLRSRALLVFGSIFTMVYIIKITAEYFENQLGWPTALVIAGLLLIAVGYVSLTINRRYIRA